MKKDIEKIELQTDIIREGDIYIAYSPALDLASHGETIIDAQKSFKEAVYLFLETIIDNGTYKEVLTNLGWQVRGRELLPPVIIGRELMSINIPALV